MGFRLRGMTPQKRAALQLATWTVVVVAAVFVLGWVLALIVAVAIGGVMVGIGASKKR